jgi:hypothetical protein
VYKLIIILSISLLFASKPVISQTNDFAKQDSLLYTGFLQNNWQQVLAQGNQMINQGFDYYYLHIRMGIAAYNTARYLLARKHLQKALKFYADDPVANSYLYGTYLMLNQINEAGALSQVLAESDKLYWEIPNRFKLGRIHMDFGIQDFKHQHRLDFATISGNGNYYGQSREYDEQTFWDAGLNFRISPTISGYVGMQQIHIKADDVFAYHQYELVNDLTAYADWGVSYWYKIDSSQHLQRFAHQIKQQSFYGNINFGITPNFSLTTAIHFVRWDQTKTQATVEQGFASDTAYYFYDGSETVFFETPMSSIVFENIRIKSNEWVFYLGSHIQSRIGQTSFSASLSKISGNEYLQLNAGQQYYPLGNLNFYGNTTLSYLNGNERSDWLFDQSFYVKLFKQNWLEASWSHGNHSGFNTALAYLVYNTPYQPQNRINTVLHTSISKNLKLRLSYSWLDGRHSYTSTDRDNENILEYFLTYKSNLITGGIQWNF